MLSQEQARDLVEWAGSEWAASRATGIPRSTLKYWLDPEPVKQRTQEWYWGLSGLEISARQLNHRRNQARYRRAKREQRRAAERGSL